MCERHNANVPASLFGDNLPTKTGNYVVTVLLLASALALALTLPPATFRQAEAQTFSRTVSYVTVYQTVYVPITIFQTLTHTAYSTSYSLTYSAYSTTYPVTYYSLTTSSVTQFINWTVSLTPIGVFGTFPSSTFGAYSDLALLIVGVLAGVSVGIVVVRELTWLNPQPEPPGPPEGILFCAKCGAHLSVGQRFCKGCGTALFYPPDPGP